MPKPIPAYVLERKHVYAQAFKDAGLDKVAEHLNDCSEVELLLGCQSCGHTQYVVYHCQTRVCPICSYWQAIDRANFVRRLLKKMKFPKMITLTIPARNEDPRETIKYLRNCFQKLRDRKLFSVVNGGAYQIEVKVKEGHFHIHMHVILDAPFIHYTQLYKEWADITETAGVQVDIRAAKSEAQINYIVKYSQKAAELRADGSDVVRWWNAVKGSRLFGTFGKWYNVKLEDLLEPNEETRKAPPCPNCGAEGFAFFVRDGRFIFGKGWDEIKPFYTGPDRPEKRHIAGASPPELHDKQMDLLLEALEKGVC